jgi:hypothetical protein
MKKIQNARKEFVCRKLSMHLWLVLLISILSFGSGLSEAAEAGNADEVRAEETEEVEEEIEALQEMDSSDEDVCHHEEVFWLEETEATCTEGGTDVLVCSLCGAILEQKESEKLGHDIVYCICTRCGEMIGVDRKAHDLILSSGIYESNDLAKSGDVVIPETVQYDGESYTVVGIGASLFDGCSDITSITLPDTIKYIQKGAFNGCVSMQSINLPEGLTYIGKAAFQMCTSLTQIDLPDSVTYIGAFAFNHCESVNNDTIRIPSSINRMGDYVDAPAHMFYDCGSTDTFVAYSLDESNVAYDVLDGILYTEGDQTLVSIPGGKQFEDGIYEMPNQLERLGELSFGRNKNITTVVLSDKLIVDSELDEHEKSSYNNYGNDLSRACYIYGNVRAYQVRETNPNYVSIDGVLYTKDQESIVAIPNEYQGDLIIPEGVRSWQDEALWSVVYTNADYFDGTLLDKVTSVSIPSTMEEIPDLQLSSLNYLVDRYGLQISVSAENTRFMTDSEGHLVRVS